MWEVPSFSVTIFAISQIYSLIEIKNVVFIKRWLIIVITGEVGLIIYGDGKCPFDF